MSSKKIIIDKLINIMDYIYNEDEIEKYEGLDLLVIELREIVDNIKDNDNSKIEDYMNIIRDIKNRQLSYLNRVIDNIYIISVIIFKLLTTIEQEGLEEDRECDEFKIISIPKNPNLSNCYFIDEEDFNTSMLYCNLEDISNFEKFININNNYYLYKLLISLIEKIKLDEPNKYIILENQKNEGNIASKVDFLKINQVLAGKIINKPTEFNNYIPKDIKVKFDNNFQYNQFSEIIEILNEYNIHKYPLDKYLRLYQILENFMYKSKICELSTKMDYRMLTIRDFKKLNETISKKEYETLSDFIKKVGELTFEGKKYKDILMEKWKSTGVKTSQEVRESIERSFNDLDIEKSPGKKYDINTIDNNALINIFPKLIYNIRNSIVHNKITEFHLSYSNLDSDIIFILERFIIGSLENMIYRLILNKNSVVWYEQSQLSLY
ncbi:MAG: hypothetical protein MR274_03470 [Clostridium sp.]|nr:hypothetical protein [Clostridium sp.]